MKMTPLVRRLCPNRNPFLLLVPIALALLGLLLPRDLLWRQLSLHAALEAAGAVIAIALAALMTSFPPPPGSRGIPAAIPMGLFVVGILNGFQAFVEPGQGAAWITGLSTFAGGAMFASVHLGFGRIPAAQHRRRILAVVAMTLGIGLLALIEADHRSLGLQGDMLVAAVPLVDPLSAALYLLAAARLCALYGETQDITYRLCALLCALLGASSLLLTWSGHWSPAWWWLHGLRWGAYTLAFAILLARLAELSRERSRAEGYWRSIIDSSSEAIIATDLDGRVTLWNRAAQQLFDYAPEEMLGQSITRLIPLEEQANETKMLTRMRQGLSVSRYEAQRLRRDGETVAVDISLSPIKDGAGTVLGASKIIRDIGERQQARARLEELLRFKETLIAQSPIGIAVYREDGPCLLANQALADSVGAQIPALLAQDFRRIPSWRESGLLGTALATLASGQPGRCLAELHSSFGKEVALACDFALLQEAGQRHLLFMTNDVTATRETERALQLSEEQFRQIFEHMSGGVVVYAAVDDGADFLFVDINPAVERIEGVRRADILGRRLTEVFPGVIEFGFLAVLRDVWCTGTPRNHPLKFYQDDRVAGWRENEVYRLSSGKVVAVYEDLTERKRAEEEMYKAHDRLLLATRAAEIGIWSWNLVKDVQTWDQRMFDLYEVPESVQLSGLLYDFWRSRCHPEDLPRIESALLEAREGGADFDGVFRILLPQGRVRYIHAAALVERDHAGRPLRMVGINRDISAQRETERVLREARLAADAASQAKSAFVANMSHEIRTPLNAVIGLSQLLLDTPLDARQRDYLGKIQIASKALLGILNDILDYSKIEAGRLELDSLDFQFEEILDTTRGLFALAAAEKGLELSLEIAPEVPPRLRGDPLRLGQVVNNLVGNAIKFTQSGAIQVRVTCEEVDDTTAVLRVTVRDSGIGLTREQRERLFGAFQQADSSTSRRYGGTGLGLTISRRLVELMGGTISVESRLGQGSIFSFRVRLGCPPTPSAHPGVPRTGLAETGALARKDPRSPGDADDHGLGWPRDVARASTERLRGARLLLVEDQENNRLVARDLLAGMGLSVTTANDGLAALALVERQDFEAILMDLRMPNMDGLQATRAIRAIAKGTRLPIIAFTAAAMAEDRRAALEAGMNDYLAKPVDPRRLVSALLRWIPACEHDPVPAVIAGTGALECPLDWASLRPRLLTLEEMLLKRQGKARGLAEELGVVLAGTALAQPFSQIHQCIRQLAFKEALLGLRELIQLETTRTP